VRSVPILAPCALWWSCAVAAAPQTPSLRLVVRPTTDTVVVGDSVVLELLVQNSSDERAHAVIPYRDSAWLILVIDDRAKQAVMLNGHLHPWAVPDMRLETSVRRHGQWSTRVLLGLAPPRPGTYRVHASLMIGVPVNQEPGESGYKPRLLEDSTTLVLRVKS